MIVVDITKSYGATKVLNHFKLSVADGEIVALLGVSGSGKTTVLNCISGAVEYEGKIEKNGETSYVYQSPRLMPWATVAENLDFVLRAVEKDKTRRTAAVSEMLAAVEMAQYADRYPRALSGGQQQRVSIARAFLYPSAVLLLDEPWRGLDVRLKSVLVGEFLRLFKSNPKSTVFVTHDIDEALLIADRIVVLDEGIAASEYKVSVEMHDIASVSAAELRGRIYKQFLG